MLENEAHHDPLNFSEDRCSVEDQRRFILTFEAVVSQFRPDYGGSLTNT